MTQLLTRNPLLRRAARKVGGALGRLIDKMVALSPVERDLPPDHWPMFPPY